MATRLLLLSFCIALGCQASIQPPSSSETLAPSGDDAAFSVGFPPSIQSPGATASVPPGDDAASTRPEAALEPRQPASEGDDAAVDDATPETTDALQSACDLPLSPGDLVIDEIMIESVAGAGDDGEWLEVRSTLDCAINLLGLHGECPRGANVIAFDVTSDFWVPAGGSFVVADSKVPAINHYLPGPLLTWAGRQGDVLRNKGATISLRMNDVLIDTVTYPALKLVVGRSWAFPSDCDPSLRGDFANWQTSSSSWFPVFFGTPNAPNDDVHCQALEVPSGDP